MRRLLVSFVIIGAIAVAGLWCGKTFAPCSAPMAALAGYGLNPPVACPAVVAETTEARRVVAPPAVTVVEAKTRPFVDRLFVSGTLVPREAQTPRQPPTADDTRVGSLYLTHPGCRHAIWRLNPED